MRLHRLAKREDRNDPPSRIRNLMSEHSEPVGEALNTMNCRHIVLAHLDRTKLEYFGLVAIGLRVIGSVLGVRAEARRKH